MKRRFFLLAACTALISLPALAGDHLDGVVPLAKDDLTALTQIETTPERHVMLYFGDHAN
jgi:hypothetical protein